MDLRVGHLGLLLCLAACGSESSGDDGSSTVNTFTNGSGSASDTSDATAADADGGEGESSEVTTQDTTQSEEATSDSADGSSTGDGDGDASDSSNATSGDGDGDGSTTGDGDGDGSTTGGECLVCDISLASTQSSSLTSDSSATILGSAQLLNETIYALGSSGPGRMIYTADTNILNNEVTDCPLWEWLGNKPMGATSTVGGFGKQVCGGLGNNMGAYPDYTFWGDALPAQYVGNPAQLRADYDVVIFCALGGLPATHSQTLIDFAKIHGGGLLLASEYYSWANDADIAAINGIAGEFGVSFNPTNLAWGTATGDINFSCFPIPQ